MKKFLFIILFPVVAFAGTQRIQNLKVADTLIDSALGTAGGGYVKAAATTGLFGVASLKVDSAALADSAKSAAQAAKLTTARTIGGVGFNGTADIVPDTVKTAKFAYDLFPPYTATISSGLTTTTVTNGITYTYTYSTLGIITSFTDGTSTWNVTYDANYNITAVTKL